MRSIECWRRAWLDPGTGAGGPGTYAPNGLWCKIGIGAEGLVVADMFCAGDLNKNGMSYEDRSTKSELT